MRALAGSHASLIVVLTAGLVLRALTELAYRPALSYYDSVAYLAQAHDNLFSNAAEPAGYPIVIRLLGLGSAGLTALITVQHLAGLVAGLLVYLIVVRRTGRKALGALGAAIVVLDGYELAVEQYAMTDAFFTLLLIACAAVTLLARRRAALAGAGLLLAAACLVRATGLFCVPVWLVYVIWRHRLTATTWLCAAAVLLPLAGYAALNDSKTGHYALTDDTAWLLYARVGSIGDCRGLSIPADERVLCPHGGQLDRGANYYLEARDSPAALAFGRPTVSAPPRVERVLLGYALHVMTQRPLSYLGLVAGSFFDFFIPGSPNDTPNLNGAITLPKAGPWLWPYYHPPHRWPADALRAYAKVIHTVRPLLALLLVIGCVALLLGPVAGTPSVTMRPAIALVLGMACLLLLGAALGHFELRYVLPAVPLLASGGMLGAAVLWDRRTAAARVAAVP